MTFPTTSNERPQRDWYWCDTCREHFYGSAAIIHKGARCYANLYPETSCTFVGSTAGGAVVECGARIVRVEYGCGTCTAGHVVRLPVEADPAGSDHIGSADREVDR